MPERNVIVPRAFPEKSISRGKKTANKRPASLRNSPIISEMAFLSRARFHLALTML
jgi:hypothetical protein